MCIANLTFHINTTRYKDMAAVRTRTTLSSGTYLDERIRSNKMTRRRARVGDIVTIDLELTPENDFVPNGFLFDTNGEVTFVVGWGNYLPGLHDLVTGMREGEQVNNVSIDAGWGDRNPELVIDVPKENFQKLSSADAIKVGSILDLKGGIRVTVTKITEDSIVVDANHPLAGSSYSCTMTVKEIHSLPQTKMTFDSKAGRSSSERLSESRYEVATWALGCFWSGELAFMRTPGVVGTKVGYTQGNTIDPTYEDVSQGTTKHREAIMVVYDPTVVSYRDLVGVYLERLAATTSQYYKTDPFAEEHNESDQYRNGIYYHNAEQRDIAQEMVILPNNNFYQVELKKAASFYDAEEYHQKYLLKGGQSARKGSKETIRCFG